MPAPEPRRTRRRLADLPGDPGPARASSEHVATAQLVARIRVLLPGVLVFAIPNGGGRTTWEASRLRAEGVLAGVPDLMIAEPRPPLAGLFVEMKRARGGRTSPAQRRVGELLRARGYAVVVAEGVEAGWAAVRGYLASEVHPGPVRTGRHDPAVRPPRPRARAVNLKRARPGPDLVPVDRHTDWGNPHRGPGAVAAYRRFLAARPDLIRRAGLELAGRRLGCWCAPGPCHAGVLAAAADHAEVLL